VQQFKQVLIEENNLNKRKIASLFYKYSIEGPQVVVSNINTTTTGRITTFNFFNTVFVQHLATQEYDI